MQDRFSTAEGQLLKLMSSDDNAREEASRGFSERGAELTGNETDTNLVVPTPDTPPNFWTSGGVGGVLRHHSRRLIAILGAEAIALGILLVVAFTMLHG